MCCEEEIGTLTEILTNVATSEQKLGAGWEQGEILGRKICGVDNVKVTKGVKGKKKYDRGDVTISVHEYEWFEKLAESLKQEDTSLLFRPAPSAISSQFELESAAWKLVETYDNDVVMIVEYLHMNRLALSDPTSSVAFKLCTKSYIEGTPAERLKMEETDDEDLVNVTYDIMSEKVPFSRPPKGWDDLGIGGGKKLLEIAQSQLISFVNVNVLARHSSQRKDREGGDGAKSRSPTLKSSPPPRRR